MSHIPLRQENYFVIVRWKMMNFSTDNFKFHLFTQNNIFENKISFLGNKLHFWCAPSIKYINLPEDSIMEIFKTKIEIINRQSERELL